MTSAFDVELSTSNPGVSSMGDYVDRHVASSIRERREDLGLCISIFAGLIGVSYQQVRKYERGINRISAGRLFDIAEALQVSVSYFFEGITAGPSDQNGASVRRRLSPELLRNCVAIDNEEHREALCQLARALAAQFGAKANADQAGDILSSKS